jgi:putative addiction module CopG family antidote
MNQTINVSLPKGLIDLAKRKVESGYYSSVSEVIRDALRKLESKPKYPIMKVTPKLEKSIAQAEKDYKEGKTVSVNSIDELEQLIDDGKV